MKSEFSEFSYGYALTEALCRRVRPRLPPFFPNLIQEGWLGFDVAILGPVGLLFLQFKLSDGMVSRSASEVRRGLLTPTFFRMHLRRRNISNQHQLLIALEGRGEQVFYAAPLYFRENDFVQTYAADRVVERTVFLRPSAIGPLQDDAPHHVAFAPGLPAYFCSEPRKIMDGVLFGDSFASEVRKKKRVISNAELSNLAMKMKEILHSQRKESEGVDFDLEMMMKNRHPLTVVRFISRTFFGAEFLVV